MYEEVDRDKFAHDNPPWEWSMCGCLGVFALLQFDDEDVPEPEGAEWLEQEG